MNEETETKSKESSAEDFLDGEEIVSGGIDNKMVALVKQRKIEAQKRKLKEQEKTQNVKHYRAIEKAKAKEAKKRELHEANRSPFEGVYIPEVTHDHSPDRKKDGSPLNPIPVKKVEGEGAAKIKYHIWLCPWCNSKCSKNRNHRTGWSCSDSKCLYGKPKPRESVPKEVTKYKLFIPELNTNVRHVEMVALENGMYRIKKGQEERIANEAVKTLGKKPFGELTKFQKEFLGEHAQ